MSLAIRCDRIGKQYRLGARERYTLLRDVIADAVRAPFGGRRESPPSFWALRDIDLEVRHGEVLGIIGRNGAGKSTLLKILSRITDPTEGRAWVQGRVGSLLEVGTGFHPELTGRENIYLNGAILGMRRGEIAAKFDEIVAFAEIERFLDTPVKHYSSGMYVRLAFAVAAHLEPEILLVDEVLAVGDAAFQRKCLGKMDDVAAEGRTVLFVSHNMAAITKFARTCLLLDEGRVVERGRSDAVIARYLSEAFAAGGEMTYREDSTKDAQILRLCLRDSAGDVAGVIDPSSPIRIEAEFCVRRPTRQMHVAFMIDLPDGTAVYHSTTRESPHLPASWPIGRHTVEMVVPGGLLNCGTYIVRAGLGRQDGVVVDFHGTDGVSFELTDASTVGALGIGTAPKPGILGLTPEYRILQSAPELAM